MKFRTFAALVCALALLSLLTACAPAGSPKEVAAKTEAAKSEQTKDASSADSSAAPEVTQPPAAGVIEPGSLLSIEEASAITGYTLTQTETKDNDVVGQKLCCYWDAEKVHLVQVVIIQQASMPKSASMTPEQIYRATIEAFPDAKKVEGIGDEAMQSGKFVYVLYKGYYVNFWSDCADDKLIEMSKTAMNHFKDMIS